ncbi:MAG: hypothetical protein QXW80_02555 [Candidatus Micrarchaeia archaeon]
MEISKKFNLKDFVLSWKESESKKDFWTIFMIILVSSILNYIIGVIGILLGIFVNLYVQLEFYINRILYNALISLNYKPNEIKFSEFLKLIIMMCIGVLIPFWTGIYAIIPLLLLIISLFLSKSIIIIGGFLLWIAFVISFLIVIFYNGLRLYLVFPIYVNLEKRTVIDAIKESWLLTKGKVLKVILYELKTIWYTILQVWIYLLVAILVLLLSISSFNSNLGNEFLILAIFYVLLTYISVVALFTRSFVQAGAYHELVNQPK